MDAEADATTSMDELEARVITGVALEAALAAFANESQPGGGSYSGVAQPTARGARWLRRRLQNRRGSAAQRHVFALRAAAFLRCEQKHAC